MIDDVAFVGLAKYCARACHVLKAATEGRSMDSLNGPMKEAIVSLEGYVDLAHPSTNCNKKHQGHGIHRAQCSRMRARHQLPAEVSPRVHRIACLVEDEDTEDFGRFRCTWLPLQGATASELSQGDLEPDDPLVAGENEQRAQRSAHKSPSTRVFTVVCCLLPHTLLPVDRLSHVDHVSIFH